MKITCQSCQSKYTVSDEKVQGKTVKIKCRKCGATIIVNSSGVSHGGSNDAAASAGGDGSYMVNVSEGDQRTMSLDELVSAYNEGVVTADTYVWADGMADWQPLSAVDAVVAALNSAAGAAPEESAPIAAQTYDPGPAAYPEPVAAAPEPAAPRAAARRDPARRSADLFGGGMAAQTAQDDVATSAPLFSAGGGSGALTGQREENSTLFSLSALTAKAGSSSSSSSAGSFGGGSASRTTATKEDSGLIDLRALAEAGAPAAAPASVSNLVPDHAGLFPLGVPQVSAPAAAPASIAAPADTKKSPVVMIVLGVMALALIVCVFLLEGGCEKPVASAAPTTSAAPPTPTAVETAAASASASASAAPSESAAADASAAPSSSAVAKGGRRGGGGKGGGAKGGGAKAPAGGGDAPAKPADAGEEQLRLRAGRI